MLTKADYVALQWFDWDEFKHPENMYLPFLLWLDRVRDKAKTSFTVTSDYRSPEANESTPGSFSDSLHTKGRALDIRWPKRPDGKSNGTALAQIVEAVTNVRADSTEGLYELGLEFSAPGGSHIHIGLFPEGKGPWVFAR